MPELSKEEIKARTLRSRVLALISRPHGASLAEITVLAGTVARSRAVIGAIQKRHLLYRTKEGPEGEIESVWRLSANRRSSARRKPLKEEP